MNTIKTVFLAALLSAAAYGVYVGVTGSPPNFGVRRKHKDWDETVSADPYSDGGAESAPQVSEHPSDGFGPSANSALSPPPAMPDAPLAGNQALPLAGDAPPDRYASNRSYPSMRDALPHDPGAPPSAADMAPPTGRYPPDGHSPGDAGAFDPRAAEPPGHNLHSEIHAEFAVVMQSTQSLLATNRLAEAHLELSQWFGNPSLSPEEEAQLTDILDRLAGTVVYSRQHLLERPHEVQPGETLEKIADAYEVPWQLLANINGIRDPRRVRAGDQLKVIHGPFGAHIDPDRFRLVLYVGNRYAGQFPVGIGEDHTTPEGEFEVLEKIINPTYYGQPVIDKDDPNNPLGEYALNLGGGIWVHGTNDPSSVGRAGSRGCIRLNDRDIKDVFEILTARTDRTAGSKIVIRRTALR